MMYYIESFCTDPHYNLALEQYIFDQLDKKHSYFMLWRNANSIIVGKYQNTIEEINAEYVERKGISVVRRLSGGGAVYHDLGNINFTFITDSEGEKFDFSTFCIPVVNAFKSLGVHAEINGRNDISIDGKKFSGNSQYIKNGRTMHHGTILFDSDLEAVSKALMVSKDKIESKGCKSVRSRVTNVKPYVGKNIDTLKFLNVLRDFISHEYQIVPYELTEQDKDAVLELQHSVYDTWEWNYGNSPGYSIRKKRRIQNCGTIEVCMNVEYGCISDVSIHGDYFGNEDSDQLCKKLIGHKLEYMELQNALECIDIGNYFNNLNKEVFLSIILQ